MASAKNVKSAKRGLYLGTFLVLPILAIPCYVGAAAKVLLGPGVEPNMVFYTLMMKAGPVVGLLLLYGVLSTIMSCASSTLFAGGMIISKDLIQHAMKSRGKQISDKDDIFLSRVGILLCTVFSIGLSLWFQGIMELMDVVMSICAAALVIPYLFAWFNKKMNTEGAITGMVAGGLAALVWTILGRPHGWTPSGSACPAAWPVPDRAEVRQGAHAGGDRRHLLFPGEIPQPPPRGKGRVLTRVRGRCVEGIRFA